MTANASTEAGWLTPVGSEPTYDGSLENQIAAWIQGITGLPEDRINVVSNPASPALFPVGENGCTFSITKISTEGYAILTHQQEESAELLHDEIIDCAVILYGPDGQLFSSRFRDGNALMQNNDQLHQMKLAFRHCSDILCGFKEVNNGQTRCFTITATLVRKISRKYNINSLVEAPVQLFGE